MSDTWDKDMSYTFGETAIYNGYSYAYINKNDNSTVGSPPNQETFTLDFESESRAVRSWTLVEVIGASLPSSPANTWTQSTKGIRGLPPTATPIKPPRYDYRPTYWPYKKQTGDVDAIGSTVDPTYPINYVEKWFPAGSYVDDGCGYNIEFKNTLNSYYSYNLVEGLTPIANNGEPFTTATLAFHIEHEQFTTAGSPPKRVLRAWAFPADDNFLYISQGVETSQAQFMSLFNTFGRRIKFKYCFILYYPNGDVTYEDGELTVNTGEYRDRYEEKITPFDVEKPIPLSPPGVVGLFTLDSFSDPAREYSFTQSVELLDPFED